jgi:hypothetical protein
MVLSLREKPQAAFVPWSRRCVADSTGDDVNLVAPTLQWICRRRGRRHEDHPGVADHGSAGRGEDRDQGEAD